jgi:malonyl-CoA O-methyltransferase
MTRPLRWLQDEIASRMMQKLELLKHQPRNLLIVPDSPGIHAQKLARRFPAAGVSSVLEPGLPWTELALVKVARTSRFIKNGMTRFPAMGVDCLELADQSQDMVFSNLWIQSLHNPKWLIHEAWRVLREGGLFTFSYLGPDTGKELRAMDLSQGPDLVLSTLPGAWDMHDVGDGLVESRFSDPVMDMEYLTLEYDSDALYLQDALALGLISAEHIPALLGHKTPLLPKKMTLELVYGHAWVMGKHLSKAKDTLAFISPDQIKRKNGSVYKQE